ncbi:MAG: DUF2125 domain-containing protein [Marinosulfonomonas sp.]|nr:DUF2125 domain-containing protein [Marinosulfonomonas sp.]
MTNLKTIGGSAAFIALMGSTAAFADVTAKEVWADWHNYMSDFGYEVNFQEAMSGDLLTISDLSFSIELPEGDGTVKVALGALEFQERDDGTVAIWMPENMPVTIAVADEISVMLNYIQSDDASLVVSGSADDMAYDYSASQIDVSLSDLVIEGDNINDAKLDLILNAVTSESTSSAGDLRHMTQAFSVGALSYDFAITEPGSGSSSMMIKGLISNLKGNSDSSIPKDVDFEQFAAALTAGFAAKGAFTWGAGGYEFSAQEHSEKLTGTSSSDGGEFHFAMDRSNIGYGVSTKGTKASFTTPELPMPIEFEIGETVFDLLMPVNKTDEPSDFGMTIKLGDFTVSDGIWGMIDPGAVLARDPATIHLSFSGKANWLVDIADPTSDEVMNADMPGQLHELTLNALQLKLAGADLTGTGGFTFNNDDLETFGGLPAPTGAIDLKLTGGNWLMDDLVTMGLLPEDMAMGARMMIGMFAVVGEGEDTLTSKIEVTADGQVLANGQRLQ